MPCAPIGLDGSGICDEAIVVISAIGTIAGNLRPEGLPMRRLRSTGLRLEPPEPLPPIYLVCHKTSFADGTHGMGAQG